MGIRRSTNPERRLQLAILIALVLYTSTAMTASASAPAPQSSVPSVWSVLHQFERSALRDYELHRGTRDVQQRGQRLFQLAASHSFRRESKACSAAARTLGFMVTGYYESLRKAEISSDWFYFSKAYIQHRTACAKDLKVDLSRFHLPSWFGR